MGVSSNKLTHVTEFEYYFADKFVTFTFADLLEYYLVGHITVKLYCIVAGKLKSYMKDLRVTCDAARG